MIIETEHEIDILFNTVMAFAKMGSQAGVNRLALSGVRDEDVAVWGFAAIIPTLQIPTTTGIYVFSSHGDRDIRSVIPKMREVKLPPEVLALGIKEDLEDKAFTDKLASGFKLPRIVLGAGFFPDNGQEHISLFMMRGNEPQKALNEIQDGLRRTY